MKPDEKPHPQEPLLERQGVVTDAIIAGAAAGGIALHGLAEGVGKGIGEKIGEHIVSEPPEPKAEVILPSGVEKPD